MARTLIIGDTHAPFIKLGYLDFCKRIQDKHRCNHVVHIGDLVDQHALSRFPKELQALSVHDEAELAERFLLSWYKAFPRVDMCIGNHDTRHLDRARDAGLSERYLRTLPEIWKMPKGWNVAQHHLIDGVFYFHGTKFGGDNAHFNVSAKHHVPAVIGHVHSSAGMGYRNTLLTRMFAMNVGCGIDTESFAFYYGESYAARPVQSCGVVIEGERPYLELMPPHKKLRRPMVTIPRKR